MLALIVLLALGLSAGAVVLLRRHTAVPPARLVMLAGLLPASAIMVVLMASTLLRAGPRADALAIVMIPLLGFAVAVIGWIGGALAVLLGRKP